MQSPAEPSPAPVAVRGAVRLGRLRDFVLLCVAFVAGVSSVFLLGGWIWFRALLFSAMGHLALPLGYVLGIAALAAGVLYVFSRPPCQP